MTRPAYNALICPVPGIAGEGNAVAGVDAMTSCGCPGKEVVRVEWGAVRDIPGGEAFALELFGQLKPLVERFGEVLTTRNDAAELFVISAVIPSDPNVTPCHRCILP